MYTHYLSFIRGILQFILKKNYTVSKVWNLMTTSLKAILMCVMKMKWHALMKPKLEPNPFFLYWIASLNLSPTLRPRRRSRWCSWLGGCCRTCGRGRGWCRRQGPRPRGSWGRGRCWPWKRWLTHTDSSCTGWHRRLFPNSQFKAGMAVT